MSTSLETSNQLDRAASALNKAKAKLDDARRVYLEAVDIELGAGASPARAQELERAKTLLTRQLKRTGARRHIMIPDLEVDPLADPEELEQRAAELRESEQLLGRQLVTLDARATELQRTVQLRKHNDRAVHLVSRYEDSLHRRTARANDTRLDVPDSPPPTRQPIINGEKFSNIDSVPNTVSDVIETSVEALPGLRSASPAQRAQAARKAHHELAKRLEQVRDKRLEIEARAGLLRGKR